MTYEFGIPYGYNADKTFPSYSDDRHLLTFGPTRSGKGATVIVQALLRAPHSVLCVDPKGQNAAITARHRRTLGDVFCLNPFGLHAGAPWHLSKNRFNPLSHLRIEDDNVVADVSSLAEALIITEGKEPYFDNTGRDLVRLLLLHLIAENPGRATLADMRDKLTTLAMRGKPSDAVMLSLLGSEHSFIRQGAGRFGNDSKDILSAINTAITQTNFLDDPVLCDPHNGTLTGSDFNMMQLKKAPTTVFLILPGRYMEAYARFFRLIVTTAIDQLTSAPGGHPTLLLLDEFATMQNLAAISKAFGFAAGYNVQCWAFLQDLPQLKSIYTQGRWESFLANAGLVQFFAPADMTTANYLKERGGVITGESKSMQSSPFLAVPRSATTSETKESLLRPEETMGMGPDRQIVFFGGTHSPLPRQRRPYWKIERLDGLWDPDPYHP